MTDTVQLNEATINAIAETVADVLEERGLVARAQPAVARILDAKQVCELLGVERNWVYDHVADLGAFRIGEGRGSQWRFDERRIREWQQRQTVGTAPAVEREQRASRRRAPAGAALIPYDEDHS